MNHLVCDAIRVRRLLRFIYEGYERIVEPHLHGINGASHEMLSAWLVGGWSESRPEPGWRNYLVRDMHDVHALADRFEGPRPKYNPFDPHVRRVFCRLEPIARTAQQTELAPPPADVSPKPAPSATENPPATERRSDPAPPGE